MKPTRFYSNKQEKSVAKATGGKQTPNSGATAFIKGDVITDDFLIECKTAIREKQTVSIPKMWIIKNEEEAFAMGKSYSAVAFDYGDGKNHYIINEKLFRKLINFITNEKEN